MNRFSRPHSAGLTTGNLDQLRRDAKRLAHEQGVSHSAALDLIARHQGFQNWSLLAKFVKESGQRLQPLKPSAPLPTALALHQALGLPRMDASRSETRLISAIVKRVGDVLGDEVALDRLSLMMDLEACHCNGCPLDLVSLLEASRDYDLVHDVMGIAKHLNRETGQLEDLFLPRYAAREGRTSVESLTT